MKMKTNVHNFYKMTLTFLPSALLLFLTLCPDTSLGWRSNLKNNWRWSARQTTPEYSHIKVYIFNVTNPAESIAGAKPILQQLGPYIYKETRVRFNISTTDMSTVKYQENKTYTFLPELSHGTEEDQINLLNIPLVSALSTLLNVPFVGLTMIDTLLKSNEQFIRQNLNVGDVLYNGIDVQLYINIINSLGQAIPPQMAGGKFGIFKGKNGTDDGVYEIQEKVNYLHNVGEIVRWQNQSILTHWNQKHCNRLRGTNGDVYPPGIDKKTTLYYFNPEACRSLPLVYQRDEEFKGIPAYRFVFPESMMEDARVNEENTCYCKTYDPDDFEPDFTSCLKKGVIDLTLCRQAPLAYSYPHFLGADPSYLDSVEGLRPDKEAHESFVVVEPKTGTVLDSSMKFQLNVQTSALSRIKALNRIPRYVFPVMWIDKTFTMNDEPAAMLKSYEHQHPQTESPSDGSINDIDDELEKNDINSVPVFVAQYLLIIFSIFVARIL